MATLVLVRHGRSTSNSAGTLAGRSPDVHLDDAGRDQAAAVAAALADVPLARLLSSPLDRCLETAAPIASGRGLEVEHEPAFIECGYGDWTGKALKDLADEPLWSTVQAQPSAVTFPGGESMLAMQARAVTAARSIDAAVEAQHGSSAVWCAVSHGDVIKSVLADAAGVHLDAFQRIVVDPASVSVIRYTSARPYVLRQNHTSSLAGIVPAADAGHEATVGGETGTARA